MMMRVRRIAIYVISVGAILAVLLAAWQYAASANSSTSFFFSSPSAIVAALKESLVDGQAWSDLSASAGETLGALAFGISLGAWLGLFGLTVRPVRPVVSGLISVFAAMPILALAPMFLIWFGVDASLKVALGALLCGLISASQVLSADKVITRELREFLETNRVRGPTALRKIVLPLATPATLRRFPDAVNAAFLGVFVGEFIAADRGIGYRILRSGSLYAVDQVLASTVLALVLLLGLQILVAMATAVIITIVQRFSLPGIVKGKGSPSAS